MPTGLRQDAHLQAIVTAMRDVEQHWDDYSLFQRLRGIANVVAARLTQIGVRPPTLQLGAGAGNYGQFEFATWQLKLDTALGMGGGVYGNDRVKQVAELGDTITHECRHCEQWFRMGRLLRDRLRAEGRMADAREITNRLGIDRTAAGQIAAAPALAGAELVEAEAWYESVYGSQASFRETTFATPTLRSTNAAPGQQYQASAFARYQRGLAEEEDAHQTGQEIQRRYLMPHNRQPLRLSRHQPVRQGITSY